MDGEGEIKPPREINTQNKSGIACITHYIVVFHFFIHVNRVKKKGRTVFAIDQDDPLHGSNCFCCGTATPVGQKQVPVVAL